VCLVDTEGELVVVCDLNFFSTESAGSDVTLAWIVELDVTESCLSIRSIGHGIDVRFIIWLNFVGSESGLQVEDWLSTLKHVASIGLEVTASGNSGINVGQTILVFTLDDFELGKNGVNFVKLVLSGHTWAVIISTFNGDESFKLLELLFDARWKMHGFEM
jgi:hypothetical protein